MLRKKKVDEKRRSGQLPLSTTEISAPVPYGSQKTPLPYAINEIACLIQNKTKPNKKERAQVRLFLSLHHVDELNVVIVYIHEIQNLSSCGLHRYGRHNHITEQDPNVLALRRPTMPPSSSSAWRACACLARRRRLRYPAPPAPASSFACM